MHSRKNQAKKKTILLLICILLSGDITEDLHDSTEVLKSSECLLLLDDSHDCGVSMEILPGSSTRLQPNEPFLREERGRWES